MANPNEYNLDLSRVLTFWLNGHHYVVKTDRPTDKEYRLGEKMEFLAIAVDDPLLQLLLESIEKDEDEREEDSLDELDDEFGEGEPSDASVRGEYSDVGGRRCVWCGLYVESCICPDYRA